MHWLADSASQCYRCRHYDWAVLVSRFGPEWQSECHSPGEYQAGDDVQKCPGFERENFASWKGASKP